MKRVSKILALAFATCATCMAFGSCGAEKPDWISDLKNTLTGHEHSYAVEWVVHPDCETQGVRVYTCDCGDVYTKKTPTAHYFIADGEELICQHCGDSYGADWYPDDVAPFVERGWWTEEEFTQEVNWYYDD